MSYFKAAPSIEKMNSGWNNEPHLDIMNEKFGVGVTEEHRQGQSLLDVFYCRRAGLILGITEWGVFTLGIWTQIILHFWSCLKLDTWSRFWSKAACCCCFGLQEERDSVLHGALCMAVLAWHSWQFSAISRKCYLILHGRESSEGSWWPCLELSVPLATQQPGVVSSNKSTKLKCVSQLQLDWQFWCLIYFVAACQCPDNPLVATQASDFCAGPVYLASDLSKAEAFSTSLCSCLHPPQWVCILCLLPWGLRLQTTCPALQSTCKLPCWQSG